MLDRVIKEGASDKGKFNYMIRVEESESHSVVSNSLRPHALYSPWNSLGQTTGVGSHSLLQGIFPTQGSNPGADSLPAEPQGKPPSTVKWR